MGENCRLMEIGRTSIPMVMSGSHTTSGLNGVPITTAGGFGSPHAAGRGSPMNLGDGSHTTLAAGIGMWALAGIGSPQQSGAPVGSAGIGDMITAAGLR